MFRGENVPLRISPISYGSGKFVTVRCIVVDSRDIELALGRNFATDCYHVFAPLTRTADSYRTDPYCVLHKSSIHRV